VREVHVEEGEAVGIPEEVRARIPTHLVEADEAVDLAGTMLSDAVKALNQDLGRGQPGLVWAPADDFREFDIIPDPRRAPISADAWRHQQALLAELGTMVNEIHGSTNHMRTVVEEIRAVLEIVATRSEADEIRGSGQDLIRKIDAWESHVPQPDLPNAVQDRIAFPSRLLSTQVLHVMRAMDQDPPLTRGSELRVEELNTQWTAIKSDMLEILDVDLREFNDLLRTEEIPNINSEQVE